VGVRRGGEQQRLRPRGPVAARVDGAHGHGVRRRRGESAEVHVQVCAGPGGDLGPDPVSEYFADVGRDPRVVRRRKEGHGHAEYAQPLHRRGSRRGRWLGFRRGWGDHMGVGGWPAVCAARIRCGVGDQPEIVRAVRREIGHRR
jgi:hypothetical protein